MELRSVKGVAEVQKAGRQDWQAARRPVKLSDGDRVRTGADSQAKITMARGHALELREKTTVKVESAEDETLTFELLIGRVRAFIMKLKRRNKFEIRTPVAVAAVRGTVFDLLVAEDRSSRLEVLDGVVGYRDLAGLAPEMQVLKGQSVLVEPGAAPRPVEPLPRDPREGRAPEKESEDDLADDKRERDRREFKAEIEREVDRISFRDFIQSDAAREMKTAQHQEGKTLIDAFGKRVRVEEYITRPAPNQFSFVSLNTREDRFDFMRFDVYAKYNLPEDLGRVKLFEAEGHGSLINWAEKTHLLASNDQQDYYREWQEGGDPVNFTDLSNGRQFQRVVFDHWFIEAKDRDSEPTLLSHWKPDPGYLAGDPNATKLFQDDPDFDADHALDIPSGYNNYINSMTLGDDRPIDSAGYTPEERLDFFSNGGVAAAYRLSEGYDRDRSAFFDGKPFADTTIQERRDATQVSFKNVYNNPLGPDIVTREDHYFIDDFGNRLTHAQAGHLGAFPADVNFQHVFTSPTLLGDRKIDIVVNPGIFRKAGLFQE
jgi:hypothetical protein